MVRTGIASIAALLIGAGVLWSATARFSVFTAEGARRAAVETSPRPVPQVSLVDMTGREFRFPSRDHPLLVEFIYTRCPTICTQLGESFARLKSHLVSAGTDARLLSISFDLAHDDTEALRGYGEIHGADGKRWMIARPASPADLEALLETFGVTVIPDAYGGFEHNAAIHHVDAAGRLVTIYGLEEEKRIISDLEAGA